MLQSSSPAPAPAMTDDELVIVRSFDAPRDLVFKMWSDPEHLVRWHGPEGMWLVHCEQDFRVGGTWRRCMSAGPGSAHWIGGEYREIRPPERLSFTYINERDQFEMLVTMDFVERGATTEMHFRQAPFLNVSERDGHRWGWTSSFNLFGRYIAGLDPADPEPAGRPRIEAMPEDQEAARANWDAEQRRIASARGEG